MKDAIGKGGGPDFTFGNGKAAVALGKMLRSDDEAVRREAQKAGGMLSRYFYLLGVLQSVADPQARQVFLNMLRAHYLRVIGPVAPGQRTVRSLARNLVVAGYRHALQKARLQDIFQVKEPGLSFQWAKKRPYEEPDNWYGACGRYPDLEIKLRAFGAWYDVLVQSSSPTWFMCVGSQPSLTKAKRFAALWVKQSLREE